MQNRQEALAETKHIVLMLPPAEVPNAPGQTEPSMYVAQRAYAC